MMKKKYIAILMVVLFVICGWGISFYLNQSQNKQVEIDYSNLRCPAYIPNLHHAPQHPFFSVVLATYNREDLLPRAICSALSQTYPNFELLIIDDGSADNTDKVVSQLTKNDPRVRYLKNDGNKGIAFTRNRGLKEARGIYITSLDSDDYFYPTLLEETIQFLDKHRDTTIVYPNRLAINDENEVVHLFGAENPVEILAFNVIGNVGASYNRQFVLENHISYDETVLASEDFKFFVEILRHGGKLRSLKQVLASTRYHHKNSQEYYDNMYKVAEKEHWELVDLFSKVKSMNLCVVFSNLNERAYQVFEAEDIEEIRRKYCGK